MLALSRLQGKLENQSCSTARGASLEAAIQADVKPTVIKPNNEELSQLLGKEVSKNVEDLKEVLQDALFDGIEWVIVSLGANGAFAKAAHAARIPAHARWQHAAADRRKDWSHRGFQSRADQPVRAFRWFCA